MNEVEILRIIFAVSLSLFVFYFLIVWVSWSLGYSKKDFILGKFGKEKTK